MLDKNTDIYKYFDNFQKFSDVGWELIYGNEDLLGQVSVTISIPTYDRPVTLKDAIDSALGQEGFYDYCVVVIDNDPRIGNDTEQLIRSYNSDRLLYYKNKKNIGMFGNQNRCFEIPKSEYVLMLHDDDLILPNCLKICIQILAKGDIDGLQPEKIKWFDGKNALEELEIPVISHPKLRRVLDIDNYWFFMTGSQTGGIYKTKVVKAVGGYNSDYYPTADFCMGIQLMANFKIYTFSQPLTIYRIGVNATLRQETLFGFVNDGYYIHNAILKKLAINKVFRQLLLNYKVHSHYEGLKRAYNPEFEFNFRSLGMYFRCPRWIIVPLRIYVILKINVMKIFIS